MKLPLSWLKRYIDISWTPEKLAEALTLSGTKVDGVEKILDESVLNIEITTNRPDCLSIMGLAMEASVLSGKKIKTPEVSDEPKKYSQKSVGVTIENKRDCPQYTARLINNVSIKPAPVEFQKCLEWMSSRPINNVVDATNFVLFETGQPLHAFDYDKILGGEVSVRKSKAGEKFLGIDGIEYVLDDKTLIIADAEKPIAIAGVMGGKLTEVTNKTKNILLESAYFDLGLVRQASKKYKLFTESSYRFERGVDPGQILSASARARDLIKEWAGGQEVAPIAKKSSVKSLKSKPVLLTHQNVEALIGLKISAGRIQSLLKKLGFKVKALKGKWLVTPSYLRRDILLEADLVEEILRIEGFDKVPAAIPITRYAAMSVENKKATTSLNLKRYLSSVGFSEIMTYSLLSEKSLTNSAFSDLSKAQKITNALSIEQEYLRPNLLPGMLQSLVFNIYRKVTQLKFFEIGNRYHDQTEDVALSIALYGNYEENWKRKSAASYYELKGVAENIISFFKIKNFEWHENQPCPKYDNSSSLIIEGLKIGSLGVISQSVLKSWDITHEVIFMEVSIDLLFKKSGFNEITRVKPMPKFPVVKRDIAFILSQEIPVKNLENLMKTAGAPYLKEVSLFDEYIGKNIANGKRSLAFSLAYQKDSGTFTDDEIQSVHAKVSEALKNSHAVEFR